MPEKDPTTYTIITYAWVFMLSCMGGVVSFIHKVRTGATRPINFTEFLGEIVTSGFTGIITFYLCEWANLSPLLTAALVGISGHMGGRALFRIEKWAERRFLDGGCKIEDHDS